jgi:hypothetical protein
MEKRQARSIGGKLAGAAGSNSEQEWALWAALTIFPSSGADVWVPKGEAVAHWIDGQALVTATVDGPANLRIVARPVDTGNWLIVVKYESAQLDDAGFSHAGLKSHWSFRLPGGETFEVDGETLVSRDSSQPDDAEKLARRIAEKMLAS